MNDDRESLLPLEQSFVGALNVYLRRMAVMSLAVAANALLFGMAVFMSRAAQPALLLVGAVLFAILLSMIVWGRQFIFRAAYRWAEAMLSVGAARPRGLSLETEGSVTLSWGRVPADLDLFLLIEHDGETLSVFHGNPGRSDSPPWASLDTDARNGFGPETIAFSRLMPATYKCYVMNYSRENPLRESGANVELQLGSEKRLFPCPRQGEGRWWSVFSLDSRSGVIRELSEISDEKPAIGFL